MTQPCNRRSRTSSTSSCRESERRVARRRTTPRLLRPGDHRLGIRSPRVPRSFTGTRRVMRAGCRDAEFERAVSAGATARTPRRAQSTRLSPVGAASARLSRVRHVRFPHRHRNRAIADAQRPRVAGEPSANRISTRSTHFAAASIGPSAVSFVRGTSHRLPMLAAYPGIRDDYRTQPQPNSLGGRRSKSRQNCVKSSKCWCRLQSRCA